MLCQGVPGEERFLVERDVDKVAAWSEAASQEWRRRWDDVGARCYPDSALNRYHAFRYLPQSGRYARLLAFGGADGQEVLPILERVDHVTVIDPGFSQLCDPLARHGAELRQPTRDGRVADPDGTYDVITCFGVLAALPDPPTSFGELVRCLAPGGYLLLSDPIVAMSQEQPEQLRPGYWRGMQLPVFDELVRRQDLALRHRTLCNFALTKVMGPNRFNSPGAVWLDAAVSRLFSWNVHYRAASWWQRLRPRTVTYVLQKTVRSELAPTNSAGR